MTERNLLIYLSLINQGDYDKIYSTLVRREELPSEEIILETLRQNKAPCITILDEDYPEYLRQKVCKPPMVLYYYGDISLIKDEEKNIAFIGSRKPTDYGNMMTAKLVSKVCKRYHIVSGLAKGIDSCAHAACVNKLGKTIAVLGSGIDFCYPERNKELYEIIKKTGLVISEYPGETIPSPENFPKRNRIIVGLSKAVVITDALKRSGTQISAAYTLQSGKDLCCVPHLATRNSLCNHLIQQGAFLIENENDIYDVMDGKRETSVFHI